MFWMGKKLQNNVWALEPFNQRFWVLPWLRRSPWKTRKFWICHGTQIRFKTWRFWIPSGCGGSILQVCKSSQRKRPFTATHMFYQQKVLAIKKMSQAKMEDNPFCKKNSPKTPKKIPIFFIYSAITVVVFQPLSQVLKYLSALMPPMHQKIGGSSPCVEPRVIQSDSDWPGENCNKKGLSQFRCPSPPHAAQSVKTNCYIHTKTKQELTWAESSLYLFWC